MRIITESTEFEWNTGNRDKNMLRHGVSKNEAEETFKNKPAFTFKDLKHSTLKEKRYGLLGKTNDGRKLSVAFTWRGSKVRIIMARDQSRKERRLYEQAKTNS